MTLHILTARMGRCEGIDITRRAADAGNPRAEAFSPPRWLLNHAKGYSSTIPSGIPKPPSHKEYIAYRNWYRDRYFEAMNVSVYLHGEYWFDLLSREQATLLCYCENASKCHRVMLAQFLTQFNVVYDGEY